MNSSVNFIFPFLSSPAIFAQSTKVHYPYEKYKEEDHSTDDDDDDDDAKYLLCKYFCAIFLFNETHAKRHL